MKGKDWDKFYESFKHAGFAFAIKSDDVEKKAESYFYFLKKYDIDLVLEALRRCIERMKWFPTISEIVREIEYGGMSDEDLALEAWEKAYKAIKDVGPNETVVFDDQVIHHVVDMLGGWGEFAAVKTRALPRLKKEFISWYLLFLKRKDFRSVPPMRGLLELNSGENSKYRGPVRLIGNREKAVHVFRAVYTGQKNALEGEHGKKAITE